MVKFRIKKIFIDNISFKNVCYPQLIIQNANCKHNSQRVTTVRVADCDQGTHQARVQREPRRMEDKCVL